MTPGRTLTHADGKHLAVEWPEPVTDEVYESAAGSEAGLYPGRTTLTTSPGNGCSFTG